MILLSPMPLPFWGDEEGYIPDVYFSRLLDSTEYVATHISTHICLLSLHGHSAHVHTHTCSLFHAHCLAFVWDEICSEVLWAQTPTSSGTHCPAYSLESRRLNHKTTM